MTHGPHRGRSRTSRAIRRGVADALRASGYEVAEAADGARGLEEAVRPGRRSGAARPAAAAAGRPGGAGRAAQDPADAAGHHPHGPRHRGRPGARPENGRRRLRRQAVLRPRAAGPRRGGAAPLAGPAGRGRTAPGWAGPSSTSSAARSAGRSTSAANCPRPRAAILSFLVAHRKRAVSREELLTRVWGIEPAGHWRRAPSTCTSPGCGPSCATRRAARRPRRS